MMRRTSRPILLSAIATAMTALAGGSCSTAQPPETAGVQVAPSPPPGAADEAGRSGIRISSRHAAAVGRKIWQNECGGTVDGLTSWNAGENFASLGIGHFIWFPAGVDAPFEESFPKLVAFFKNRRIPMPEWVAGTPDCPWPNRAAFQREFRSSRMNTLRALLKNTVSEQTEFIILRLDQALPKMLAIIPSGQRGQVRRNFHSLTTTSTGLYALIDYVNFKGEGTNPRERYQGQGWGLLQVLQEMRGSPGGAAAAGEFSHASKRVLQRRVANSPPARKESRWLQGWMNRCNSYARPLGN